MFFGTPHGGGDKKAWLKLANNYKGFGKKCKMIDVLANNTDDLIEIDEDFCRMAPDYTIMNFIELRVMPGAKKPIVDKTSAVKTEGTDGECIPVDGDHITMCQFRSIDEDAFLKVCKVINRAAAEAAPAIPETIPGGQALLTSFEAVAPQARPSQRMLEPAEHGGQRTSFFGRMIGKGGSTVDFVARISPPTDVREKVHKPTPRPRRFWDT